MRPIPTLLLISLPSLVCFGQRDTVNASRPAPSAQSHTPIPGVDAPLSAPGTLLQSPPNPNAVATPQQSPGKGKRNTTPPSDPRAFGVSIPVGKTKKDSIK